MPMLTQCHCVRVPGSMVLLILLLCGCLLTGVQGVKKCRINCENKYMPVCGHDQRLGYHTFCSVEALSQCNSRTKGNNYTRVADGPCYPSVREWRTQSTTLDERPPQQPTLDLKKNSTSPQGFG